MVINIISYLTIRLNPYTLLELVREHGILLGLQKHKPYHEAYKLLNGDTHTHTNSTVQVYSIRVIYTCTYNVYTYYVYIMRHVFN